MDRRRREGGEGLMVVEYQLLPLPSLLQGKLLRWLAVMVCEKKC